MASDITLTSFKKRGIGKRPREDADPATQKAELLAPRGSQLLLRCLIEEDSVGEGRIHFDKTFTKQLVTDTLGLPSPVKAPLR
jgi:hypothetical protein